MPCWERRTQTLDMGKADPGIIADALTKLRFAVTQDGARKLIHGWRNGVEVTFAASGKLDIRAVTQAEIDTVTGEIRRGYTAMAFRRAATKAGFQVQERPNGQFVATRRRY